MPDRNCRSVIYKPYTVFGISYTVYDIPLYYHIEAHNIKWTERKSVTIILFISYDFTFFYMYKMKKIETFFLSAHFRINLYLTELQRFGVFPGFVGKFSIFS